MSQYVMLDGSELRLVDVTAHLERWEVFHIIALIVREDYSDDDPSCVSCTSISTDTTGFPTLTFSGAPVRLSKIRELLHRAVEIELLERKQRDDDDCDLS